ncbi:MAG: carboxypeptidase-like regulatory domain-containing protein [Clostridiaceae bacterium]
MYKYELAQSTEETIDKFHKEIRIDLILTNNKYYNNALIYGFVYDYNKKPVANSLVSFIDDNEILGSVYTNSQGFYCFIGLIICSKIKIIINKDGFQKLLTNCFIVNKKFICKNFYINNICPANQTIISGHIFLDEINPPTNIFVYLISRDCYTGKNIINTTITNDYGQFVFYKITKGDKYLIINDQAFNYYSKKISISDPNKIYNININLVKRKAQNIIEGCIKNSKGVVIPNSMVVLFKIDKYNRLKAISYTKCDCNGFYIFSNMPKGNYIVKSIK